MVDKTKKDEKEEPTPRLVQAPNMVDEDTKKAEENVTESARSQYVAGPHDGIWNPAQQQRTMGEPASRKEQIAAFEQYQERPDIESRASILARENAAPGQFSDANVSSGAVDDGKVGPVNAEYPFGKDDDEAEEEAESIDENLDALK